MNNANNRISAMEIRREAHKAFRKDIRGNISLNVIPILLRFLAVYFGLKIYNSWMANLHVNLADPEQASRRLAQISANMANDPSSLDKYMLTLTPQTSVAVYAFMVFFIMICVGVSYTLLDKLRKPDYQINALGDVFKAFSGKYFFPLLFITALFGLFLEAGFMLYIIPGIWFLMIFSQVFLVFKDDVEDQGKWTLRMAFSTFNRSAVLMRGYKWTYFSLCLEFFFWEILNGMTRELLSVWLQPYEQLTMTIFYQKVLENNQKNQAR
ncbi:integral membrane protein [Companilactobacillus mindensis DSM 14500]|uniref:Integral membrane protein n=1 Tax=Companilactobacillus mindensis DSM 14500 TaxID=1423770 RepID=A0A0R1QH33_9LACO|nr:DUF975 family protein [Companilactobacillus mindensis]KRL44166.1 integral membrane protein [Companilactobacillus mindensis DSM 14500]GEO79549.1 hypothetical protein LMI01_18800 [Companilactobacillus mindensis]